MSRYSSRPPPIIIPNGPPKFTDPCSSGTSDQLPTGGLSPDLQTSPPVFPDVPSSPISSVSQVGRYILTKPLEDNATYQAVNVDTQEPYICKVFSLAKYQEKLSANWALDSHPNIQELSAIVLGKTSAYVFFSRHTTDLHSYIRSKKNLKEQEAKSLFGQVLLAVQQCHQSGVILRDLKLRKFAFTDHDRLEGLDEARVLPDPDEDTLAEKHGCPAYVSPEILQSDSYSGKAADMWSVGVILYTMLFGRYPFHDSEPRALFDKIRLGHYLLPGNMSARPKCLLRSLLCYDPLERLTVDEALEHPWFSSQNGSIQALRHHYKEDDQTVPDTINNETSFF